MNLLDTDIIIEMLRERRHEIGAISIIALIEILRGLEGELPSAIAGGFLPRTLKSLTSLLSEHCLLGRLRAVHSYPCC